MANLFGRMIDPYHSGRREVTRTAATMIQTKLETWEGSIKTKLDRDGTYRVFVGSKHNPNLLVAAGNVNGADFVCPHPARRLHSWHAYDGTLCVACSECGEVLSGEAKLEA
jgi:hypothetical protein